MSDELDIQSFCITRPERDDCPSALFYSTDEEDLREGWRSEYYGAILIRLWVDGNHDAVTLDDCQSDPREVLEKGIARAQEILERLNRLHDRRGRCMGSGDWGRCRAHSGHEGEHDYPTEEEWEAEQRALRRLPRRAS